MNTLLLCSILLSMQASLRTRLLQHNAKSYGPLVLSGSETVAELLAGVGYSHLVVDTEHAPVDAPQAASLLRAIDAAGARPRTCPVVRVPSGGDAVATKRILDVLRPPAGVMFPMIEDAAGAAAAVAGTRYPPGGVRGCAHPFVRASRYGRNPDYFETDARDLLTIVQVESAAAIENIPEIGMVDGVDVIFLGPFDISCSIGRMGEFREDGEVMRLLRRAERLVRETSAEKRRATGAGLVLGGFRSPGRSLEEMFSEEVRYQFVCGAVDLGLLGAAASADWEAGASAMG